MQWLVLLAIPMCNSQGPWLKKEGEDGQDGRKQDSLTPEMAEDPGTSDERTLGCSESKDLQCLHRVLLPSRL